MRYKIDWKNCGVVVSFAGTYDFPTSSKASEELYADSRSNSLKYIVFDLSGIDGLNYSFSQIEFPAMRDKVTSSRLPEIRKGFVVKDELVEKVCRSYVEKSLFLGTPWKFLVSDCLKKVLEWAGGAEDGEGFVETVV